MSINENLSRILKQYKKEHKLTFDQLAALLDLPISSVQKYYNGTGNPRADTLELIARKLGIPLAEIVSPPSLEQEQAETAVRIAKLFSGWPPEDQESGLRNFFRIVSLFSKNHVN